MIKKDHRFEIYRYQLIPIDRFFQGEFFGSIHNINDLLEQKNALFLEVLRDINQISEGKNTVIAKKISENRDFLLFQYAVNRSIVRETEKFTEEQLENWPSFLVGFWNDKDVQKIIVEERFDAFQHTETIISAIEKSFNEKLKKYQLRMHTEALFDIKDFWKIIEKNQGKINSIDFELITPNMANISKVLPDELKDFAKLTNTATTNYRITADQDSALSIDQTNRQLSGLVNYSSEGGGNIKIKAKGIKRQIQTSKTKRSIEMNDIEISANNADDAINVMKGLLQ